MAWPTAADVWSWLGNEEGEPVSPLVPLCLDAAKESILARCDDDLLPADTATIPPAGVALAVTMVAARLFTRHDSPFGVVGSTEYGTFRVSRFDPDVEAILAPWLDVPEP